MMSSGSQTSDRAALAAETRAAAEAVWLSLASGYGPHGGHRLLDLGDDVQLVQSAAGGLNEQALPPPFVPFQDATASVRSVVGDQSTLAGLLLADLVRSGLDAEDAGIPRTTFLDGMRLAHRQVRGLLSSSAKPCAPADALSFTTQLDPTVVELVLDGFAALAEAAGGTVTLDDVDIVVEPNATPEWSLGVLARPQHGPEGKASNVGVTVCSAGWTGKPRIEGISHRISSPQQWSDVVTHEATQRRAVVAHLLELGIGFVATNGSVDTEVADEAARQGIHVWSSCPKDALRRLAAATGAQTTPTLEDLESAHVGRADLRPRGSRREGLWVEGPAAAATLLLSAQSSIQQGAVLDDGDRLLRAASIVMADARGLPGGGRWQRHVADGLRRASAHAPGKQSLAVERVAACFDRVADALVSNAGFDPMLQRFVGQGILDPAPCVDTAVDTAFEAAHTLLRLDGRYDKRPSTPEALRGGDGPIGSPKGMPGDVPPLM